MRGVWGENEEWGVGKMLIEVEAVARIGAEWLKHEEEMGTRGGRGRVQSSICIRID